MAARNLNLVVHFEQGTNTHHREYMKHLRNTFLDRVDNYPTTEKKKIHIEFKSAMGVLCSEWAQEGPIKYQVLHCNQMGH